jgi:hypothetical protein
MMKTIRILLLITLVAGLSSCGSTIIVANHPQAQIYVNGVYEGTGTARITRAGIPKRTQLEAVLNHEVVAQREIRRQFDGAALFGGFFTYGIGFFTLWRYPKEVHLNANEGFPSRPEENIWERPPGSR